MANLAALDAFIGFGQYSFVDNEKTWLALKGNKGDGKYNFKDDNFDLPCTVLTGIVIDDDYWLCAIVSTKALEKNGCIDISIREEKDGKWTVNTVKQDEICKLWCESGQNVLIHCNDIPVLKTFVGILHEYKMIVRPYSESITVRFNITDEQCKDIQAALCTFLMYAVVNGLPKQGTPEYDAAQTVNLAGLMALPVMSNDQLPSITLRDLFGQPAGEKINCFPFTGELPSYTAVTVTPPKKADKKGSGKGGYGGATVTTTVTGYLAPQDRAKYIADSLRAMGVNVQGDDIAAINACIAEAKPAKGENPVVELVKLAYQMTTDNWILQGS